MNEWSVRDLHFAFPPNVFRACGGGKYWVRGFVVKHAGPEKHLRFSCKQSGYGAGVRCELFIRPSNSPTVISLSPSSTSVMRFPWPSQVDLLPLLQCFL